MKLNDEKIVDKFEEVEQFMSLCRGQDLRPESTKKSLQCRMVSAPWHPRFLARKVEIVSNDPFIAMVHDFITDSEAEDLKATAAPKLRRSTTAALNGTKSVTSNTRISEQTWLMETENQSADRLTKRIKSYIGLNTESVKDAELWQVANYGLSGQYYAHYDAVLIEKDPKKNIQQRELFNIVNGDRIATVCSKTLTWSEAKRSDYLVVITFYNEKS